MIVVLKASLLLHIYHPSKILATDSSTFSLNPTPYCLASPCLDQVKINVYAATRKKSATTRIIIRTLMATLLLPLPAP